MPKKPAPRRVWTFRDGVYGMDYYVCYDSWELFRARVKRRFKLTLDTGQSPLVGMCTTIGPKDRPDISVILIWFDGKRAWADVRSRHPRRVTIRAQLIAHEALHATIHALHRAGVAIDPDHSEPACYYHDWLVGELSTVLPV